MNLFTRFLHWWRCPDCGERFASQRHLVFSLPIMTLPLINSLEDETVRVMVSESDGWIRDDSYSVNEFPAWRNVKTRVVVQRPGLPNYPASLDAMAEARKTLTPKQMRRYTQTLRVTVIDPDSVTSEALWFFVIDATARQHCNAFLVAVGKARI